VSNLNPHILVIDDEHQIRKLLKLTLEANGYNIHLAETGKEGLLLAANMHPHLIILDLGLPDKEGVEVLKELREWLTIPIIILSARTSETDIVSTLDAGANDYLIKPFRTGELLARVRFALRHSITPTDESVLKYGNIEIDLTAHMVKKNGEHVKLTPIEFSLLSLFARNAGKVLTHQFTVKEIWGPNFADETQYLRVYINQLRKKLEDDPAQPQFFLTESGIGYRFNG